jgi:hypothetical protein
VDLRRDQLVPRLIRAGELEISREDDSRALFPVQPATQLTSIRCTGSLSILPGSNAKDSPEGLAEGCIRVIAN